MKRTVEMLIAEGVKSEYDLDDAASVHKKVKIDEKFVQRNIKL
jgi:hypothetical protein